MSTNPFESIDARLSNIENILLDINRTKNKADQENNKAGFAYTPIQDIFRKKICSKPTFYKHLKAGAFTLYKFGNKSFVDAVEFQNAFHKVKLTYKK